MFVLYAHIFTTTYTVKSITIMKNKLFLKMNEEQNISGSNYIIIIITTTIIIVIIILKRCSLTRVKLIALYKHIMTKTTLTYISNKQNLKYCS